MTNATITKEAIEIVAKQEGIDPLEMISMMQTSCAERGDETTLEKLCKVKREFINF